VKANAVIDPGFLVRFLREDALFHDETTVADLKTEILDHMHAVVEFHVDDDGFARWRITKNRFAPETDWKNINTFFPESINPPAYKHLRNAWMKAHYVILLPELLPSFVFSRLRDELSSYGGIRLYRNGFRVVPYGDQGNDWLGLDELYVKRTFLAPISNRNFLGVVEVRDPEGRMFEEHTSREGLLETTAFSELKHITSAILVTAAGAISDARGKKTRASDKKPPNPERLEKLKSAVGHFVATATEFSPPTHLPPSNLQVVSAAANKVIELAQELEEEIKVAKIHLADETAMLRLLATLGMTTAEFSHETGMTFDAFRFDFEKVFDAALEASKGDLIFAQRALRARGMLSRLETLTAYLNSLASSRSARDIRAVSLSKVVEEFHKGISLQAATQQISIAIYAPDYDPLYTAPLHEAEVASVLLNLYTNSVKAMKRAGNERKIGITVSRSDADNMIRLIFSDTGDGVRAEHRERIFDAFFTTAIASPGSAGDNDHSRGTGLGLWIVDQIVSNAHGEISVIDPEAGFVTSFELLLPRENEDG
jgi:signal transduction histidine kinase